jgi:cytochrome c peroxidase
VAALNKVEQEEKYRAKSGACYLASHKARTPSERQAWLELGRDWDKLADEVRDQFDAPLTAPLEPAPLSEVTVRVFQPSDEVEEVRSF